jgi:hypothetical protein
MDLHGLLRGQLYFFILHGVHTSQETPIDLHRLLLEYLYFLMYKCCSYLPETHLPTSTACYRDGFTFWYVDDIRTSQETHLWTSMAFTGMALLNFIYSGLTVKQSVKILPDASTLLFQRVLSSARKLSTANFVWKTWLCDLSLALWMMGKWILGKWWRET